MPNTRIILISGLFGMKQSPLLSYVPAVNALATEFGADTMPMEWDTPSGFAPYSAVDRAIVIAHSFGGCRAYLDALAIKGNLATELHLIPIDAVRFTTNDSPENYESAWAAQFADMPFEPPCNVASVRAWHREIRWRVSPFDFLSIPVNSIWSDCNDLEVKGVTHNGIVDDVRGDVLAGLRTLLEQK